jgi:hypothetical protein
MLRALVFPRLAYRLFSYRKKKRRRGNQILHLKTNKQPDGQPV